MKPTFYLRVRDLNPERRTTEWHAIAAYQDKEEARFVLRSIALDESWEIEMLTASQLKAKNKKEGIRNAEKSIKDGGVFVEKAKEIAKVFQARKKLQTPRNFLIKGMPCDMRKKIKILAKEWNVNVSEAAVTLIKGGLEREKSNGEEIT